MSAQIPSTQGVEQKAKYVLDALKENVEHLRGRRADKITTLSSTATTSEIISKINEIINRLQA